MNFFRRILRSKVPYQPTTDNTQKNLEEQTSKFEEQVEMTFNTLLMAMHILNLDELKSLEKGINQVIEDHIKYHRNGEENVRPADKATVSGDTTKDTMP